MKRIGVWMLLLQLAGCGAAGYRANDAAPETAAEPFEEYEAYDEEAAYEKKADAYEMDDGAAAGLPSRPARMRSGEANAPVAPAIDAPSTESASEVPPVRQAVEPMIIYSGYLQLRVKRLLDAVDRITALVEERGGYIDSMTQTAVVVRIPGKGFEEAMAALAATGELLDRWVRAQDVTEQFTDLRARLDVAEEARERLLELLSRVKDVRERLRILQEIKRLSELIDTIDSSLAAIRNLVDYFTITIDLVPVLAVERVDTGLSPFGWIHGLKAHTRTLYAVDDAFSMKLPKGFVLFDEDEAFRAQAADTTVIRAATVRNDPAGDNRFWADALDFEMTTRQEKIVDSGEVGGVTYRVYENDDVLPRFYLVGVMVRGESVRAETIQVVEVFYPDKESYERHHAAVLGALETVEVK